MSVVIPHARVKWPSHIRRLTLVSALILTAGCKGGEHSPDQPVLDSLATHSPQFELDHRGKVITLKLESKELSAEAFDEIGRLSELRQLSLWGSAVTDADLGQLKGLKKLRTLGLGRTTVTDRGVAHLKDLPSLEQVWLPKWDKISDRSVSDLKKGLPALKVHFQKGPVTQVRILTPSRPRADARMGPSRAEGEPATLVRDPRMVF